MRIYDRLKEEFDAQAERFWTFIGEDKSAHTLVYRSDNDRLTVTTGEFSLMAFLYEGWYAPDNERNCVAIHFTSAQTFNVFRNTLKTHVITTKEQA